VWKFLKRLGVAVIAVWILAWLLGVVWLLLRDWLENVSPGDKDNSVIAFIGAVFFIALLFLALAHSLRRDKDEGSRKR
jgi:preprotein translocase subunit SecG